MLNLIMIIILLRNVILVIMEISFLLLIKIKLLLGLELLKTGQSNNNIIIL
jgi:hypothetical protein